MASDKRPATELAEIDTLEVKLGDHLLKSYRAEVRKCDNVVIALEAELVAITEDCNEAWQAYKEAYAVNAHAQDVLDRHVGDNSLAATQHKVKVKGILNLSLGEMVKAKQRAAAAGRSKDLLRMSLPLARVNFVNAQEALFHYETGLTIAASSLLTIGNYDVLNLSDVPRPKEFTSCSSGIQRN
jgi:hypothetical protein